ncbi:MAG: MATE family efflux transporter, partial [Bacteroidales bacterium]|nr:MATE family efflux transporter [Bacteroidales bacterium]
TALNNGPVSAVISFTRTLIFELGCVFLLPLVLGIDGIWLAVNVAEVLALILSAALVLGFRKRYGY